MCNFVRNFVRFHYYRPDFSQILNAIHIESLFTTPLHSNESFLQIQRGNSIRFNNNLTSKRPLFHEKFDCSRRARGERETAPASGRRDHKQSSIQTPCLREVEENTAVIIQPKWRVVAFLFRWEETQTGEGERDYGGTNPAQGSVNRDWCSQSENGMKLKRRKLKAPLTDRSEIKLINWLRSIEKKRLIQLAVETPSHYRMKTSK